MRIVAAPGDLAEMPNVLESVRLCKRYENNVEVHGDQFEQFM